MALLTVVFISNICYLLYGYTEAKFGKYREEERRGGEERSGD